MSTTSSGSHCTTPIAASPKWIQATYPLRDQYWRAAWFVKKLWYRRQSRALANEVLETLDRDSFDRIFRKYGAYFSSKPYSKYLNARHWLFDSATRFHRFGLHRLGPGKRFLDLGCGAGYFLVTCRHRGHYVQGIDVDSWPLFNDLIELFSIERHEHRITPSQSLPSFSFRFNVITAFMTAFNNLPSGMPWSEVEWVPFLRNIRQLLTDDGIVIMKFNANKRTREFYPRSARAAIESMPEFRARFRRDILQLDAKPSASIAMLPS
jgi:SAM-dependent methyltransferase